MKSLKISLITVASLFAGFSLHGATGFFGNAYVIANDGIFYQAVGNDGTNPQLSAGFGTLNVGGTFNIQGFELRTFEDNGSEITHMNMFWTVDNFDNVHQIQIFPAPSKSGNDRLWQISSAAQNLLTNNGVGVLAQGNYTFQAYFEGYTNGVNTAGNIFLNNSDSNYTAEFTVIPEPSTYAALAGAGLLLLVSYRRFRAKK